MQAQGAASVHEYASDYLRLIKGEDCKIESCDAEAIRNIHLQYPEPDMLLIVEEIGEEEFNNDIVLRSPKSDEVAAENDLIEMRLSYFDGQTNKEVSRQFYLVSSQDGQSFPKLQRELIEKKIGYQGTLSDSRENYQKKLPDGIITFTVEQIYSCRFSPGYISTMNSSGIDTIAQFYDYLINVRLKWKIFENQFQFRQDFLTACLDHCRFFYSEEQIEAKALNKVREYQEAASALGMSLEDYWIFFRENAIGVTIEEDLYKNAVESAKRDVGVVLFVGWMSQKMGISVSDAEVQEAFEKTNNSEFQTSPGWNDKVTLRYELLQDKVIATFVPEYVATYELDE
jgi:FKBP-type peptidyl-prolyl cis-trans isomerase (trigger factor)